MLTQKPIASFRELNKIIKLKDKGALLTPLIETFLFKKGSYDPSVKTIQFLLTIFERMKERDLTHFHASAAENCGRQQLLGLYGYKGVWNIDTKRDKIFDDGKWRHLRWQAMFKEMGIFVDCEVNVSNPLWHMVGSVDVVVAIGDNPYVLVELKGTNDRQFNEIRTSRRPLEHHVYQLLAYLVTTGSKMGILFYENKNTQEMEEFIIRTEEYVELIEKMNRKFAVINKYRKRRKLAGFSCTLLRSDKQFKYCSQAENCLALAKKGDFPQTERNLMIWKMYNNQSVSQKVKLTRRK